MPQHNRLPLRQPSEQGPVIGYIKALHETQDRATIAKLKDALGAIRIALETEGGSMLLELLEKSTTEYFLPPSANERALDALNAQRFILLDLRRIMSDETDALFSPQTDAKPGGRGRITGAR